MAAEFLKRTPIPEIDPSTGHFGGNLPANSLNAFYLLHPDWQPFFLKGLQDAANFLRFDIGQLSRALEIGPEDNTIQRMARSALANQFAERLDPEYISDIEQGVPIAPAVEKLRDIYLKMITGATPQEIRDAVKILEKRDLSAAARQLSFLE